MPNFSTQKTRYRVGPRRRTAIALLLVSLLTVSLFWASSSSSGNGPQQAEAAENVVLTIDASRPVYPFKDTIRGVATNNWNWLWSGLWDRGSGNSCCAPGKTAAIIDATSYIEPGIIRFAGGLWVNRVGWSRNSSAPDDGAWTYRDPQTGQSYNYTHAYKPAMIQAFQDFRTKLGAQAMIQVNICDNNIRMWQDMVRYTNIERNFDFEYWELGNEQSLEPCGLNPTSYAQRYAAYQTALKQVDPSIKIMGPVAHQPYFSNWEDALVSRMGSSLDVLAFHWYQLSEWTSSTGSFAYQGGSLEALMAWGGSVGSCQDGFGCPGNPNSISAGNMGRWTYRRGVAEQKMAYINSNYKRNDPTLETAITEFGVHASAHTHPINGNHVAAIWLADVLGRWAYNGLDIITYYSLEDGSTGGGNSRGLLGTGNNSRIDVRPTYYSEFMYAQYFGDMMVQSTTSDPEKKVSVWASTDSDDPGKLKLMLINLSGDNASAQIRVNGFTPRSGQAYVMRSSNPLNMSSPGSFTEHSTTINGVRIPDYEVGNPSVFRNAVNSIRPVNVTVSNNFNYSIPPYSVVALTLDGSAAAGQAPAPTPTASPAPTQPPQATPTPGGANAGDVRLMVSTSANRNGGVGLAGQSVKGNVFVSLAPDTDIVSASFYINNQTMSGTPLRVELLRAFDLMGTAGDGSAQPLNTLTLPDGEHTVTARVGLRNGTSVVSNARFTVSNVTPAPTATPVVGSVRAMASTAPDRSSPHTLHGATVAGLLHAWAEPAAQLRQVQFYIDDLQMARSPHQVENLGPFDMAGTAGDGVTPLPFDTTSLSDGAHTLTMAATLQNGQRSVVHTTFTVNNNVAPVTARVSNSADRRSPRALRGATVSGNVYAWADAGPGVVSVSFYINDMAMSGAPRQVENIAPFDLSGTNGNGTAMAFNTASLSNGTHTLTMQATLANGAKPVSHVQFTVRN